MPTTVAVHSPHYRQFACGHMGQVDCIGRPIEKCFVGCDSTPTPNQEPHCAGCGVVRDPDVSELDFAFEHATCGGAS